MAKQPSAASKTSSKIAKKETTALSTDVIDLQADAGQGFEQADKDSFAIPFLKVLQALSPQCKKQNEEYIKGAEEGMLYNTVSKELVSGEEGVILIPCMFDRKFTEWAPKRGGFRGEHPPGAAILQKAVTKEDSEGKLVQVLPNGNSIQDSRYFFCLQLEADGSFSHVLVIMSSSGIKKAKQLMTSLDRVKLQGADGKMFTPPMFLNKVLMKTVHESKDDNDWFNWAPEIIGQLDISDDAEADIYLAAKAFRDSIIKGQVKVQHTEEGGEQF